MQPAEEGALIGKEGLGLDARGGASSLVALVGLGCSQGKEWGGFTAGLWGRVLGVCGLRGRSAGMAALVGAGGHPGKEWGMFRQQVGVCANKQ